MTSRTAAYRSLPANERQEFRLPTLLKDHLAKAAARRGQTVAEYLTVAVAERVAHDLAETAEWHLSVPEQELLLRALAARTRPSARARSAAKKADSMFGPLPQVPRRR